MSCRVAFCSMTGAGIRLGSGEYLGTVVRRMTAADVTLVETSYADGTRLVPHRHASPTFFHLLRGAFVPSERPSEVQRAGATTYHPSDQLHGAGVLRGRAPRGFNVELGPSWSQWCKMDVTALTAGAVPWLLTQLYHELRTEDASTALAIHGLMCQIVAELARRHRRIVRHHALSAAVTRAAQMLRDGVTEMPTWSTVAGCVGCEPGELALAFRARHGCRPDEYVRTLRLERARRDLAESARTIAEIATAAGFYDQPHFTRAFKARVGVTPAQYRRLTRG